MTEPSPQQLGNIGVSAVGLKFERSPFWWGVADNSRDDRGIDLLVKARDSGLSDQEFPIGVQVKTGEAYFKRPKREHPGEITGWWYPERNQKRFKYWLGCNMPVLLVLHREDGDTSYWVHVTREAVVWTGQGAKILVPRDQTITEQNKDQLLDVATRQEDSQATQGTDESTGLAEIPTTRQLRFALVAPRLIAPRPTTSTQHPIDAVETVALLAQGRFRNWSEIAHRPHGLPNTAAMPAHADWGWQFAGAIWDWLATDSLDKLASAYSTASAGYSAAASGVLLACALTRQELHRDAIAVLKGLAERDDLDPVDRGWVLVQRARAHANLDEYEAAHSDATDAQRLLSEHHGDATVPAFAASAARTLYVIESTRRSQDRPANSNSAADWAAAKQKAFRDLLQASDTKTSWWRDQDVALALSREQDTAFESWAEDDIPDYMSGHPIPETRLFAAELNADITGEHGEWRALSARRGQQALMRAASSPDISSEFLEGLDALRRSGHSNHLTKAIRHLLRTGPLDPLTAAINKIPMSGWTRTTARTNLEALALAGDLIEQPAADELLEQCARAACGDTTELGCTQDEGYFSLPGYATDAAAGVLPAASTSMHNRFAGYLARLPEVPPIAFLRELERALSFLHFTQVESTNRQGLLSLAQRGHPPLSAVVWGWFASHGDTDSLDALKQAAIQGDIHALVKVQDPKVFEESERAVIISALERRVEQACADAAAGGGTSESTAFCYALTRLNLTIPNAARWESVITLLGEPRAYIEDKKAIYDAIVEHPGQLPADIRDRLVHFGDLVANSSRSFWPGTDARGVALRLRTALRLVADSELDGEATARLALGSHQERHVASRILRLAYSSNRRLLLRVLRRDTHFTVRFHAARTIAYLIASEAEDADIDLAWEIARSNGRQLPLALIQGFGAATDSARPLTTEIIESLQQHPSAAIRHHGTRLQQRH